MATITTTTTLEFDAAASLTLAFGNSFQGSLSFTSANDDVQPSFVVTKPQEKTYGPFGIAMTVLITVANGSIDYTINGGMGGFGYDTNGNVTSLVSGDRNWGLDFLSPTGYPAQISRPGFTPARVIATGADGNGVAGGWAALNGSLSTVTDDLPSADVTSVVKCLWSGSGTMSLVHKIPSTTLSGKFEILVKFPKLTTGTAFWYFRWSAVAPAADPPTVAPASVRGININAVERADGVWTKLSFDPRSNRFTTGGNAAGRAWSSTEALPSVVQYLEIACDWTSPAPEEAFILVDHVAINGATKPMVVLGFDGFYASQASIALPLFQKYGLKGYGSSSGNNIAGALSTCQSLYNAGWDLISQAQRTGNYGTDTNGGSLAADLITARAQFDSAGFTRAKNIFTYPFNSRSPATDAILLAAGYEMAIATNGITPISQLRSGSMLALGRLSINNVTAANMQAALDAVILEGSHVWMYGHNLVGSVTDTSTQTLTSEFTTFMAYLADKHFAGTVEVVTPSEFLARS